MGTVLSTVFKYDLDESLSERRDIFPKVTVKTNRRTSLNSGQQCCGSRHLEGIPRVWRGVALAYSAKPFVLEGWGKSGKVTRFLTPLMVRKAAPLLEKLHQALYHASESALERFLSACEPDLKRLTTVQRFCPLAPAEALNPKRS